MKINRDQSPILDAHHHSIDRNVFPYGFLLKSLTELKDNRAYIGLIFVYTVHVPVIPACLGISLLFTFSVYLNVY